MSLGNYDIEDLHIAKSAMTDRVYVGFPNSDKTAWNKKKDVTDDFVKAVVDVYGGYTTVFNLNGDEYKLTLTKI